MLGIYTGLAIAQFGANMGLATLGLALFWLLLEMGIDLVRGRKS